MKPKISRNIKLLIIIALLHCSGQAQQTTALSKEIIVEKPESSGDFPIVSIAGVTSPIRYDQNDHVGVTRAIADLQTDIERSQALNPLYRLFLKL